MCYYLCSSIDKVMESTSDNNKTMKKNETENKAESEGFNETLKPADDSFKT